MRQPLWPGISKLERLAAADVGLAASLHEGSVEGEGRDLSCLPGQVHTHAWRRTREVAGGSRPPRACLQGVVGALCFCSAAHLDKSKLIIVVEARGGEKLSLHHGVIPAQAGRGRQPGGQPGRRAGRQAVQHQAAIACWRRVQTRHTLPLFQFDRRLRRPTASWGQGIAASCRKANRQGACLLN